MGNKNKGGKSERANIRLEPQVKAYLERAAIIDGCSLSNFIIASGIAMAKKVIKIGSTKAMTQEESHSLYTSMVKPPASPKALKKAFAEYRRMEFM